MIDEQVAVPTSVRRNTRKKDHAPRGVFRLDSGVWAIRYVCGAGHTHEERVGLKSEAIRAHQQRRARVYGEPGWCPKVEKGVVRESARQESERQGRRTTFSAYAANDYMPWARQYKRSWAKDQSRLDSRVLPAFGDRKFDEITTADIERFLGVMRQGEQALAPASVNRIRDLLSGMYRRALRLGLVAVNPVTGIPKLREASGRVVNLTADEEAAIAEALPPDLRSAFALSLHTGLRWSEQAGLRWRDIDMLTRVITVRHSKNGDPRHVPINPVVRSVLVDLGSRRQRPSDSSEPVFALAYRTAARLFIRAVKRAQAALRDAGKDASKLDGYTWHGNRHTFASRLVMTGADLLSVKALGGWKTLSMVQRYAHLSARHLAAAVDRLAEGRNDSELGVNLDFARKAAATAVAGVS